MTDIQRHLKDIRKLLRGLAARDQWDHAALTGELRALLPESYGISTVETESARRPLLIYDAKLAGNITGAPRLEHTLLVIEFIESADTALFQEILAAIARLKALRPTPPSRKAPDYPPELHRKIPKERIPFALVFIGSYTDATDTPLPIGEVVNAHPAEHRPDEIVLHGQGWHYLNPLLHYAAVQQTDRGWSVAPDLAKPRACYACKMPFVRRHFFYDRLCVRCADLNYAKRISTADLHGRIALVTGARIRIGYATALRLLRAGATVIAVSRFPNDTARLYAQERDFEMWRERLHVYALDLRQARRLRAFIDHLYERFPHLDIVINNAAQTVKRPPAYYAHLLPFENMPLLPDGMRGIVREFGGSMLPGHSLPALPEGEPDPDFPPGQTDPDGEQIDNRAANSWTLTLDQVSFEEMLEVHLINAVVPGVLAGQLKALLMRSPHPHRYIINVSAAEGRFAAYKVGEHPHTNMAKAALNMLTRTIATEYAEAGIYVNSVDPGWVSDQMPHPDDASRAVIRDLLPLDMVDAAARLCDPIFEDISEGGGMYKDYQAVDW
jgi:NAD(P)-dependent dehydrogenase (short-subunit alcohol dehydrogenase family)